MDKFLETQQQVMTAYLRQGKVRTGETAGEPFREHIPDPALDERPAESGPIPMAEPSVEPTRSEVSPPAPESPQVPMEIEGDLSSIIRTY